MIGKSGTVIFSDTCRCFHAGSRKSKKPRTILMIQYLSPFAFHYPHFNLKTIAPYSDLGRLQNSLFLKLLLGYE